MDLFESNNFNDTSLLWFSDKKEDGNWESPLSCSKTFVNNFESQNVLSEKNEENDRKDQTDLAVETQNTKNETQQSDDKLSASIKLEGKFFIINFILTAS